MSTVSLPMPLDVRVEVHPLLAGLDGDAADPDAGADSRAGPLGLLAASGPRCAATSGVLAPDARRRPGVRLRTHRLEGAVVAVLAGWILVGVLTLFGWV